MARRRQTRPSQTKIPDRYREGEDENLNKHWQTFFLDKLAETSNVSLAASYSGASVSRAYKLRRERPEFARKWHAALLEGYEHLELETLRRLRFGTEATEAKFDIANALRLLSMHKETVARERARIEDGDEGEIIASINAKIADMRRREREIEEELQRECAGHA